MVTEPTARQRPQPVPAVLAAVAGVALALSGSAPAAADPPGVPVGVHTQAPNGNGWADPYVPPWLDPAREPALTSRAVTPKPESTPAPDDPPPATEPSAPAEPPPPVAEPTREPPPPAAEPTQPATAPTKPTKPAAAPTKPKPRAEATRPGSSDGDDAERPEAGAPPVAVDPPPNEPPSGQGADWAARPLTDVQDTRGLDERVPTVVPSPTPPAQPAARLAAGAAAERPDGFARSLMWSGLIGLVIALYGLSMIGRRRRTW